MYTPKHFEINDREVLLEFMREFPFATLVTNGNDGLHAEHIPMLIDVDSQHNILLQAHIAKSNSLWQRVTDQENVLIIFQGENSYITPNWYPSKKENGKVVPTWNYRAVHIKGAISYRHEFDWKLMFLEKLTAIHEQSQTSPWLISDAPKDFIEKILPAIVGIEINVSSIIGKFKLSQNQSSENRNGVKQGLAEANHTMANLID